jgi:hypothetical protein
MHSRSYTFATLAFAFCHKATKRNTTQYNMDSERETPIASTSATPASSLKHDPAMLKRKRTHIQMGDTVLLQLPSKNVRVARMKDDVGIISLGKYGAFDARTELIGRPYGVTYEIVPLPMQAANEEDPDASPTITAEQVEDNNEQMDIDEGFKQEDDETSSKNKPDSNGKQTDPESNQPLCTLRPFEELTEEIEVTEATNENILATGAKVRPSLVIHIYITHKSEPSCHI